MTDDTPDTPDRYAVSIGHIGDCGSDVHTWAVPHAVAEALAAELGEPHVRQTLSPQQLRAVLDTADAHDIIPPAAGCHCDAGGLDTLGFRSTTRGAR